MTGLLPNLYFQSHKLSVSGGEKDTKVEDKVIELKSIQGSIAKRQISQDEQEIMDVSVKDGLLQDIGVAHITDMNDKLMVVFGNLRKQSLINNKVAKLKMKYLGHIDSGTARSLSLKENLDRFQPSPGYIIGIMHDMKAQNGMSNKEIANAINRAESFVSEYLKILDDDKEIQDAVMQGKITPRKARTLRNLDSETVKKVITQVTKATERDAVKIAKQEILNKDWDKQHSRMLAKKEKLEQKIGECSDYKKQLKIVIKQIEGQKNLAKKVTEDARKQGHDKLVKALDTVKNEIFPIRKEIKERQEEINQLAKEQKELDLMPDDDRKNLERENVKLTREKTSVTQQIENLTKQLERVDRGLSAVSEKLQEDRENRQHYEEIDKETKQLKIAIQKDETRLKKLEEKHAKEVKDYKKLNGQVRDLTTRKEKIYSKLTDLIGEKKRLTGFLANEKTWKKSLKDIEASITSHLQNKPQPETTGE